MMKQNNSNRRYGLKKLLYVIVFITYYYASPFFPQVMCAEVDVLTMSVLIDRLHRVLFWVYVHCSMCV